ncbi:Uncharacterised protein [Mycobacteroides abscessus subsp. abscessus]|nr:Uncharacterised protein [Mycobacteroides abscessus subsp. abscessus]
MDVDSGRRVKRGLHLAPPVFVSDRPIDDGLDEYPSEDERQQPTNCAEAQAAQDY